MSNKAIELHDSTISSVQEEQGRLEILFDSAYIHESNGRPGVDDGTGWAQTAKFVFDSPVVTGKWPAFPACIRSGTLEVGQTIYDNVIPLPLKSCEAAKLSFTFLSKEAVVISANGINGELAGNAKYIERFRS